MNPKLISFYLINYAIIFFAYIPHHFGFVNTYFPALDVMFIFYFYSYKNLDLSYSFIFINALLIDAISQNVLGTTALIYFFIIYIFSFQQKIFFFKSFTEIWLAFFLFTTQYFLLESLLNFFITGRSTNIQLTSIEFLASIALYPFFHLLYQTLSNVLISHRYAQSDR